MPLNNGAGKNKQEVNIIIIIITHPTLRSIFSHILPPLAPLYNFTSFQIRFIQCVTLIFDSIFSDHPPGKILSGSRAVMDHVE